VRCLADDVSEFIVIVDQDEGRALGVVPGSHVIHDVSEHGRDSLASMRALEATSLGVHFLSAKATVEEAFRRLVGDERARCVIVVDEQDHFEGLITPRDVLRALGSPPRPSTPVGEKVGRSVPERERVKE
jgi:CBS domain-containing protein